MTTCHCASACSFFRSSYWTSRRPCARPMTFSVFRQFITTKITFNHLWLSFGCMPCGCTQSLSRLLLSGAQGPRTLGLPRAQEAHGTPGAPGIPGRAQGPMGALGPGARGNPGAPRDPGLQGSLGGLRGPWEPLAQGPEGPQGRPGTLGSQRPGPRGPWDPPKPHTPLTKP